MLEDSAQQGNSMPIKSAIKLLVAITLISSSSIWAQQQNPTEIKTTQLGSNVYMLVGQGGNIGLITGADGSLMIDDQFAPLTPRILKAVESVGGDTPRYLLNTHFHGDHTGGNINLGKAGTLIMSHHAVRQRLQNGSYIPAFGVKAAPASPAALPIMTFAERMHLHINDETIRIIHVPNAHTDGDSFVVFERANVVHTGDLFFNGFFPFIDAANGGSMRGVIAAADQILALADADTKIIPGHGPLASRQDLQTYRDMLATVYDRVLKLKNQGMSADEILFEEPLAEFEEDWGGGTFDADKWIEIVYPAVY